jgi:hypothetical protein
MHLEKFLHSHTGKVLTSIVLGVGLVSLFKTTCKGKNCIIVKAPPVSEILTSVYRDPKYPDCIKFDMIPVKCDKSKKIYQIT